MMLDLRITSEDGITGLITINGKEHLRAKLPMQESFLFHAIHYAAASIGLDAHAFLVQRDPVTNTKPLMKRPHRGVSEDELQAMLEELGI